MDATKMRLDPFRALMGVIERRGDSDAVCSIAHSAGLLFDENLSAKDAYSHKTRIRALMPHILAAYDALDDGEQLAVVRAALVGSDDAEILATLEKLGWSVQDGALTVTTPDLREMFFPKGSPWDAHVVLRKVFSEARRELTIIDAYADTTIFQLLPTDPIDHLIVRVLCSHNAHSVAAEAVRFAQQYPGIRIEVKQSRDFHDRFIVIDGFDCVHLGSSIKDAGKTACLISYIRDDRTRGAFLIALGETWEAASALTI